MFETHTSTPEGPGIIAIVGAVTGTLALGWNLVKHYLDNRVKLVVHVIESYVGDDKTEIRAEIFNNGSVAVTIREVLLEAYFRKRQRYGVAYELKNLTVPMPARLDAGGHLIVRIEMDGRRMQESANYGELAVAVYHSRSRKPRLEFYSSLFSIVS